VLNNSNNTSNFNQALWLGIGQLCTFAIAFLTAPIMARYFDKVEYATYKQVLYVYTSLQSLFLMGLPNVFAYFIPRLSQYQQKSLINKITFYFFLIGIVFSVALYFSADLLANLMNNPNLSEGLKIFSPFPLFTLPAMGVEGIYTAIRKTKYLAFYHIFTKLITFLCIIVPVVFWNTGYKEAIMGWGIASFISFLLAMFMKSWPYKGVKSDAIPNINQQIFSYSLPLLGAFIAGFFCSSADQFFVSRYYGTQVYAEFINGCISIPVVGMIAGSVKGVLLPMFSKADKDNELVSAIVSYTSAVKNSAVLILPLLIFCIFFSSEIIVALFGEQYIESSQYFRVFTIRDIVAIFPYFAILMAFGYSRLYMMIHVWGAFLIWTLDYLIIYLGGSSILILIVSTLFYVSCSFTAFIYIYNKKNINLFKSDLLLFLVKILLHCSAVSVIVRLVFPVLAIDNLYITLGCCVCLYYFVIILSGKIISINYMSVMGRLLKR